VAAAPPEHPLRWMSLNNLGIALRARFQYTGTTADLNRAVAVQDEAVKGASPANAERAGFLSDLCYTLLERAARLSDVESLHRAAATGREALTAMAPDHTDRPGLLGNLASALLSLATHRRDPDYLAEALRVINEALAVAPDDHPERPWMLYLLSNVLRQGYVWNDNTGDLDDAVDVARRAAKASASDHPLLATILLSLSDALVGRFDRGGNGPDLAEAIAAAREASSVTSAPVVQRIEAARRWGRLAGAAGDHADAIGGFAVAVGLSALVVPRELTRPDQEFRLRTLAGLGPEAAAAALAARQSERAVEMFEQGRAVLFSQLLDDRSDVSQLRARHPVLADEFVRLTGVLDRGADAVAGPGGVDTHASSEAGLVAQRRDAAAALAGVLQEIRAQPGFGRFRTPRTAAELQEAATEGPVVLLNIAELRSDAIILTARQIAIITLTGVGPREVARRADEFLAALHMLEDPGAAAAARASAEDAISAVLAWLSDTVTGPVLDHLGYSTAHPEDVPWPRVWWCPSGFLSLLPLHAAGHHEPVHDRGDAVVDRVVSSTTPTLRALLHARRPPGGGDPRILVVRMPVTPGEQDLPGAAHDAETLTSLWSDAVTVVGLVGEAPATCADVTALLPQRNWVHFACHGASDLTDPSASRVLLVDRALTVTDLTQTWLPDAELAFLGACTTARSGLLADEPIHLAAACQLAGYRHVVASLWAIDDVTTAALTGRFYRELKSAGSQAESAAHALHRATRLLRAMHRRTPSRWAPFTHAGP
jgi:tetratricopeptide (TPR) repeat protein